MQVERVRGRGGKPFAYSSGDVRAQAGELAQALAGASLPGTSGEAPLQYEGGELPALDGVLVCGGRGGGPSPGGWGVAIRQVEDPTFFAVSAGEWPWGAADRVLTLDWGKSYLKMGFCGFSRRFARNFDKFPMQKAAVRERGRWRRDAGAFVRKKLAAVVREAGDTPETLVIGLPCELDGNAMPLAEAWPGMEGWSSLAEDLRKGAGPALAETKHILLCNDAELAAWSALMSPVVSDWNTFAVLTAGTGLGLALASRAGWPEDHSGNPGAMTTGD